MRTQNRHNELPLRKYQEKDAKLRNSIARGTSDGARRCRSHPKSTVSFTIAVLLIVGVATFLTGRQPSPSASVDPRTHVTVDYTACLLTSPDGINSDSTLATWKGMQAAASTTNERVTSQSAMGAQTLNNATAFINTLAAQKCAVIIAVSQPIVEAAEAETSTYPAIHFIAITSARPPSQPAGNFIQISTASNQALSKQVTAALISDFAH